MVDGNNEGRAAIITGWRITRKVSLRHPYGGARDSYASRQTIATPTPRI
jgi:hypothetical protein